jgi:hypothetical protein
MTKKYQVIFRCNFITKMYDVFSVFHGKCLLFLLILLIKRQFIEKGTCGDLQPMKKTAVSTPVTFVPYSYVKSVTFQNV